MSVKMIKILLYWAKAMGAASVPSFDSLQNARNVLRSGLGGSTQVRHKGVNGHTFYANTTRGIVTRVSNSAYFICSAQNSFI
jgi:hypothetical protein